MQSIEWRPVVGYEGLYEVSNEGAVKSLGGRGIRGKRVLDRILRPHVMPSGHRQVALRKEGRGHSVLVHRLVARAFIGECPPGHEVRHLDGNPGNNQVTNLRYGTRSENVLDQVVHGVHNNARKTHCRNGHEYTDENTIHPRGGGRTCRTCNVRYQSEYQARRLRRIA